MRKEVSSKIVYLTFGVLVICFAIASFTIAQWTEPGSPPPQDNVATPLNVSNVGQSKAGGLVLNTGGATNGLIVDQGRVGIGTASPSEKLDVEGNIDVSGNKVKNYKGFPTPNYDSGWFAIANTEQRFLTHNLGGNRDNYIVDLYCRNANGPHQWFYGFYDGGAYGSQGIAWSRLSTTRIQITRSTGDDYCATVRVRIWVYE